MKRVLIITSHRKDRAPNQRFRFEQYLPFLEKNGFQFDFSPLFSESDDKLLYTPGHLSAKLWIGFKAACLRLVNVLKRNEYDIIFIAREGFITGTTFFESLLRKSKAKIIYDFDDAIWHFDVSKANKRMGWLKNPGKTAKLISFADLVFAGNNYLADYAKHHADHVVIVPTTIDTDEYCPVNIAEKPKVCIGWSGSYTTIRHFEMIVPALKKIKQKFGDQIYFKVIGDGNFINDDLGIQGIPWSKEDELMELSEIDIGIMPLPDDEWSKGKCGLKGLQYMALNIVTIMSPVGVNSVIIEEGINGFLAGSELEWVEKISVLITNKDLRKQLGAVGRKTVIDKYSVNANKALYLHYFNMLTKLGKS